MRCNARQIPKPSILIVASLLIVVSSICGIVFGFCSGRPIKLEVSSTCSHLGLRSGQRIGCFQLEYHTGGVYAGNEHIQVIDK